MKKTLSCIFYLSLALLLVSASSSAQVVHENPSDLYPSYSITIQEELNYLLESMQFDLEAITEDIRGRNFSIAREDFEYYNASVDEYRDLLWRMNLSDPVYQSIVDNIDFSRYELRDFIVGSEAYNENYVKYTEAVAGGDTAAANASAEKARASYEKLLASYDRLRSNTTAIEKVLQDNNIDKARYEASLNNINDFMGRLSVKYGKPGFNETSSDLTLTVQPPSAAIGDSVLISTVLKHDTGTSVEDTEVSVYFNNVLVGQFRTDSIGSGSMSYAIPMNVSSDVIDVHAEASDAAGSRYFSNDVILKIKDIKTLLTLEGNGTEVSYGGSVNFTGLLTAEDGTPLAGRIIYVVLNEEDIDTAVTDRNGSYAYEYHVTPYMPESLNTFYTAYDRSANGVFLSSLSEDRVVTVLPKNTTLSLAGGTSLSIGDNGLVNGTLVTEEGIPVEGADIAAFIDDVKVGNNTTDSRGTYSIVVWVPANLSRGAHKLYTSFDPGDSRSLCGSSSSPTEVTLGDSVRAVEVAGLPLAVFKGDRLDINGTIRAGSGTPLAGQKLDITIEGANTTSVISDAAGRFNLTYTVDGNESIGLAAVRINESGGGGGPAVIRYTGQVLIVPIDKFLAFSVPLLLIVIVFVAVPLGLRVRKDLKGPGKVILDDVEEPKKTPKAGPVKKPAADIHKTLNRPISAAPQPFRTETPRIEEPGAKPTASRPPTTPPAAHFDIDAEIVAIRAFIDKNDQREALSRTYLASRKVAIERGLDVQESMTHTEFYALVRKAYPASAQFLLSILRPYETVIFAGIEVQVSDLSLAANGLRSFYDSLKNTGEIKG